MGYKEESKKLAYWEKTKDPLRYAEKIEGVEDVFKYRVGDYRILAYPNFFKKIIIVLEIDNRDHIYDPILLKKLS